MARLLKCFKCKDNLEIINTGGTPQYFFAGIGDTEEMVELYACLSRDCSNRGVVIAIPVNSKED